MPPTVLPRPPHNYWYWMGGLLLAASFVARVISYPVITSDYTYFLSKWFDALQTHPGLTAFTTPFSDYAPLYLYFLKALTYLPVSSLYSVKTLSVAFDIVIACAAYVMIKNTAPLHYSKPELFFAFAVMLSIPTEILNSALWGQSDAIYASGVILSLYFMLQDKALPAVLWFSFAICVKLQAIFFLPVLVGYCLRKERSAGYLLAIPFLYFLSIIPARLGGGALSDLLLVYAKESGEYSSLSVSAQNVFVLFSDFPFYAAQQYKLFLIGIGAGLVISITIAAVVYFKKTFTHRAIVFVSLLCVLVLPYVLPRMHERYFYLADVLSVIYVFYSPKSWYMPVLVVGASLLAYMPYLSQLPLFSFARVNLVYPSLMVLLAIVILLVQFYNVVVTADTVVS